MTIQFINWQGLPLNTKMQCSIDRILMSLQEKSNASTNNRFNILPADLFLLETPDTPIKKYALMRVYMYTQANWLYLVAWH